MSKSVTAGVIAATLTLTAAADGKATWETVRERPPDGMSIGVLVLDAPPNADEAEDVVGADTEKSNEDGLEVEAEEDDEDEVVEVAKDVWEPRSVVEIAASVALVAAAIALLKPLADFAADGVVGVDRIALDVWDALADSMCNAAESGLAQSTGDGSSSASGGGGNMD